MFVSIRSKDMKLSNREEQIMDYLWEHGPTFVKDILLLPETDTLFRNTNQAIKLAKRIKWL